MPDLRMPSLGADMTSGRLLEWHVEPGDTVHRGDIVATVDTDKAEIEIETFEDGVVDELVVVPGTKVPVGGLLATFRPNGRTEAPVATPAVPEGQPAPPPLAAEPSPAPAMEPPPAAEAPPPPPPSPPRPPPAAHRPRVSPLARRIAADLGIDLTGLAGTGPGGAIVRADVEAAAAGTKAVPTPPAPSAPEHRPAAERHASLRAAVGDLMARSKREIPHYVVQSTIELGVALDWLATYNATRPPAERLLPAALLLRAVALATHDVPEVNGTFAAGAFRPARGVTLGVAVSLRGGGIIAPAIPHADALALPELMQELRALTGRARRGVLRGADLAGDATLTVTSLGDQGADLVQAVIFPPQVAIVGFGRIALRPVARDGMVGARPTVVATLAGDHRVSDGHLGSLFLASVDHHLQEPQGL